MITTHILDISAGQPARGLAVKLEHQDENTGWIEAGGGATDADGRISKLISDDQSRLEGIYRLTFDTGGYFGKKQIETFYPEVKVTFEVTDPSGHYHVPLLLSPYGYSTYRGS